MIKIITKNIGILETSANAELNIPKFWFQLVSKRTELYKAAAIKFEAYTIIPKNIIDIPIIKRFIIIY